MSAGGNDRYQNPEVGKSRVPRACVIIIRRRYKGKWGQCRGRGPGQEEVGRTEMPLGFSVRWWVGLDFVQVFFTLANTRESRVREERLALALGFRDLGPQFPCTLFMSISVRGSLPLCQWTCGKAKCHGHWSVCGKRMLNLPHSIQ